MPDERDTTARCMPEPEPIIAKPIVASYCTTFLKPEMRHIYRQVTGLRRFDTFVMTRERLNEDRFPFDAIEQIPRARKNFIKRFWLKYVRRRRPVYYRGELQVLLKMLRRRPADLMHIYFGHIGVHLLPFIEQWKKTQCDIPKMWPVSWLSTWQARRKISCSSSGCGELCQNDGK